ncbi:hypothetical protein B0O80DRAFT_440711 [Mortierella sp. GBAus27b]|nr:hypothetical protein BGX31_004247 [Mortierella sp. GBA43]KAI8359632.1 hypothetical protein B0O80DRAFT_440711 [Mortierella sp. GBAus27b]
MAPTILRWLALPVVWTWKILFGSPLKSLIKPTATTPTPSTASSISYPSSWYPIFFSIVFLVVVVGGYVVRQLKQHQQQQRQEQLQYVTGPPVYSAARQCPTYPAGVEIEDKPEYSPPLGDKKLPIIHEKPVIYNRPLSVIIPSGIPFEDSNDKLPQFFVIAPPQEDPFVKGKYKPFRILAPCQAPSLQGADLFHMTEHEGYTIKNPKDLVAGQYKTGDISFLNAITAYLFMGAEVAGTCHGFSSPAHVDMLHNRRRPLTAAGVVPARHFYCKQSVVDQQQTDAMRMLLRSAGITEHHDTRFGLKAIRTLKDGTKWVCEDCYQLLSHKQPIDTDHLVSLDDYIDLTRRSTDVEVTLRCSSAVTIFTKTIQKKPIVRRAMIHVESKWFQERERQQGPALAAIENQFNELGRVFREQPLTAIEIRGDRACGPCFDGLQRVLKCTDLKSLHVSGVPRFLQGARFDNNTWRLKDLQLDGVHLDTQDAAFRLTKLMEANPELMVLRLSRTHLTSEALDILEGNEVVKKRFAKLTQLSISDNIFGASTAVALVGMALQGKNLALLDFSNNRGFGDAGCRQILELLRFKDPNRLEYIFMNGTDISEATFAELQVYNKHQRLTIWRRILGLQ